MDKIYVVYGTAGDWPDGEIWLIAAYTEEEHALRHVDEASKRAKEVIDELSDQDIMKWDLSKYPNDYDKDMNMDDTGPSYWCEEIELYGDILEYKLMI